MSKRSRSKGKRGERIARELLVDNDWIVLANTADGSEVEDVIASCPKGVVHSIEVKNRKAINITAFKQQASTNAKKKKLPWMVMCKIEGSKSWLVWCMNSNPVVWTEK
jgi:Holliday junction resolvase-like predicted endonuclease